MSAVHELITSIMFAKVVNFHLSFCDSSFGELSGKTEGEHRQGMSGPYKSLNETCKSKNVLNK